MSISRRVDEGLETVCHTHCFHAQPCGGTATASQREAGWEKQIPHPSDVIHPLGLHLSTYGSHLRVRLERRGFWFYFCCVRFSVLATVHWTAPCWSSLKLHNPSAIHSVVPPPGRQGPWPSLFHRDAFRSRIYFPTNPVLNTLLAV